MTAVLDDVLDRELEALLSDLYVKCDGFDRLTDEPCGNDATWLVTIICCGESQHACDRCRVNTESTMARIFGKHPRRRHRCGATVTLATWVWTPL